MSWASDSQLAASPLPVLELADFSSGSLGDDGLPEDFPGVRSHERVHLLISEATLETESEL